MRFGLATHDITPPQRMSMGGYFDRDDAFDTVHDPLTLTALVLEEDEKRAVIVAADLVEFPWGARTWGLMDRVAVAAGCPREAVVLNASHTHGGPQIPALSDEFRTLRDREGADRYCDWLEDRTADTVRRAVAELQSGSIDYFQGTTDFAINRRGRVDGVVQMVPWFDGPIDDRLQGLLIKNSAGKPVALGMRMACHPTTVGSQHQITSDFVGAWRNAMRDALGLGVTPFFLQGCCGDSRPRASVNASGDGFRRVDFAELAGLGKRLAHDTMNALLSGPVRRINRLNLAAANECVTIDFRGQVTDAQTLASFTAPDAFTSTHYPAAIRKRLAKHEPIPRCHDWHVQTLWLDDELALITLDTEPVAALARHLERAVHPRDAIVLGYTNGCLGYLPDSIVLADGGYETQSWLYEGWSGPFERGVEHDLVPAVMKSPAQITRKTLQNQGAGA